jgi:NAD(P)-dependent dehydrogenase (short-subunit alcohol dehydrogenase family)
VSSAAASPFGLAGRVALVTGGSRGLGRAMVAGFARAGADVVIASRNGASCAEYAREITETTGRQALGVAAHVGHWAELENLVEAAYQRFGRVDILVNNAGMSPVYGAVTDITEELFDKVVGVNLKGPFRLAALVGTRMAAAKGDGEVDGGSIINISSMAAVRPRADLLPYAAAKAGLNAITVGLAHALGPAVRCNAIMAGTFLTDVSRSWDTAAFEARAQRFALRRGGQPDEIVGAALYLASDAASYTTGTILTVDGGQP